MTAVRETYEDPTLPSAGKCRDFLSMVPRNLGKGLVLLKQVPAQGLAKCGLSQPTISHYSHLWPLLGTALELCCCLASPSLPVFPGRLPTVWYLQQVSSRPLISQQPLFTCLSLPSDPESLEARGGVLIYCHPSEFIQESCWMEAYMMCRRG